MRALLHTEFAALLVRADVSQAAFARISGYTPRQVNTGPAVAPQHRSGRSLSPRSCNIPRPKPSRILLEELAFPWHETLGVPANADAGTIRRAWARLARAYHPDAGGTQELMTRLNAAYERAGRP